MKSSKMKKVLAGVSSMCVLASVLPAIPAAQTEAESANFVAGDANCSGGVDIADAIAIMAYVTNSNAAPLTGQALDNADVYQRGDGIGVTEAVSVQKYLTKLISGLPESYMEGYDDPVTSVNYIHLKNTSIETEGDNMVVNGTAVTITASGEYYVDGTLDDGQIIVNVPDETVDAETVKIFLNGVSITGSSAPAIWVENAENTSINLMEGTTNTLSDGTVAYSGEYLEAGVIHAKDDITIKGTGTLDITANTQYAIQCNNDIKFTEGTVNIETILEDAVRGKKSVTVKGTAVLDIDAEGDGIKSTQGDVAIEGGTVSIKAGNDAVQAETTIDISGGTVTAGGDRGLTGVTGVNISGGSVIATATDNQTDAALLNATQGTMLLNCIADASNTDDGCWKKANTIIVNGTTYAPNKKYMYVLISDAAIASGQTYNLTNGSTGATVSHTNNTSASFTTTGTVTSFNTVDMNPSTDSGDITVTPEEGYTITLGNTVSINAPESVATVSDNVVTIIQPSVFSVSGTASEGQIVVDVDKTAYADGVVELDLMGANLTSTKSSPVYVAQIGDEVQLVAKSGYDNVISDGTSYTNADGGMGAVYSCDDLKIKGSGNLTVNGNAGDGIVSKNDLKVYNGNITVNAADDCIRGKDSVTIGDADDTDFSSLVLNLSSKAGDGIKANAQDASTTDKTYGVVDVNGGTINMNVYGDGIQAAQLLNVNGGNIDIETTGSKDSGSAKGLKGGLTDDTTGTTTTGVVNVNGGFIELHTNDDGINSNGDINMLGGKTQITVKGTTSGYQGLHADTTVNLGSDGKADVFDD
ncbi:MAG: carbohydrate-binding domain-containing protein, partial [Ruminococcus sp.]|nr:carbohydrate-binding domain-containing protein [Ruminococcus sp.]